MFTSAFHSPPPQSTQSFYEAVRVYRGVVTDPLCSWMAKSYKLDRESANQLGAYMLQQGYFEGIGTRMIVSLCL
jgi:hypothetical protein